MNSGMRKIVIDGNLCGNGTCRFRGLGAAVGEDSSGLLTDYKIKQPEEYREITELLFKKNYGAGLSHIRIDCKDFMEKMADESEDLAGNFPFAFAADAREINNDLTVELYFDFTKYDDVLNLKNDYDTEYILCRDVIGTAFEKYGLKVDYISFESDRSGRYISEFIKYFNNNLKSGLLCNYDYSKIKIAAYDTPDGIMSLKMLRDEKLRNAVDAIGYGIMFSNENIKVLSEKYHKEIWCCDGMAVKTASELSVNADGMGIAGKDSLIDIMDNIIFSFNKYSSMYEYNPGVLACFPKWGGPSAGLIRADTPWSGYYSINAGLWGAAHITHFTEPGWKYADCESVKEACSGEYGVFISDKGDYTAVFVNSTDMPIKYSICVRNTEKADEFVHCVETRGPEGCDDYTVNWFRVVDKIMPAENIDGCYYTLEVKPFSVMTCTTLSVDNVSGTESVKKCVAENKVMPLPYSENFNYNKEAFPEKSGMPFYAEALHGQFEIVSSDGENVLMQSEAVQIDEAFPVILFGDDAWSNYSVKADVKFDDCSENNYVGAGLRYNRCSLTAQKSECGYQLRIYSDCRWQLRYMDRVLEDGAAFDIINPSEWNQLKISAKGRRIRCYINKELICEYILAPPAVLSGRACLYSSYNKNTFKNLMISPVIGAFPYSTSFDCLCGKFTYSDGWVKNISAAAGFSNFTSVSNSGQNEYLEFEFTGETVALSGRAVNLTLKVEIDNKIMTAGLFIDRCDTGQVFYLKENLGDGVHHLKLTILSGQLEFDCAEVNTAAHLISRDKISRVITEKKQIVPAKKLKKSTLLIGIGLAAAGAGALLIRGKIKKRRNKK